MMAQTKKIKIAYWVSTIPVCVLMAFSAWSYFQMGPQIIEGAAHTGYPLYFFKILGGAKALGVTAILVDRFKTLKEWAYAGFTFNIIAAVLTHYAVGDALPFVLSPLVVLLAFGVSYYTWKQLSESVY